MGVRRERADHLGDDEVAIALHQDFKWAVIAKLSQPTWSLTSNQIETAVQLLTTVCAA